MYYQIRNKKISIVYYDRQLKKNVRLKKAEMAHVKTEAQAKVFVKNFNAKQKQNMAKEGKYWTTGNRKTDPIAFLKISYNKMWCRVKGYGMGTAPQSRKRNREAYIGLDILDRQTFINKFKDDFNFLNLYKHWQLSNYNLKSTPTVDRLDSSKGYTLDNIRYITFSENCLGGLKSEKRKLLRSEVAEKTSA